MATGQRARKTKTSKGKHGAGGKMPHLTGVQKILLGGGLMNGVQQRYKIKH